MNKEEKQLEEIKIREEILTEMDMRVKTEKNNWREMK